MALKLRAAHSPNPRIQALLDGSIQPTGIELEWNTDRGPQQLFHHQLTDNEFDVFEFSISSYMISRDRPNGAERWPWLGIPIFLSRAFLCLNTHVNVKSGVNSFADMKGKSFGIPDFNMTAGTWMRAMINDLYAVRAQDVTWYVGRLPGQSHAVALGLTDDPPKDVPVHWTEGTGGLASLLQDGTIDAAYPAGDVLDDGSGRVRPMFTDGGRGFIADFVKASGYTPVNHTLAIQRRIVEENPWVPEALFEAFHKAKLEAYKRDRATGMLFKGDDYERQAELFGADPYPSGLGNNRAMLQRCLAQEMQEGMIRKPYDVDTLWCESLRGT